jgi:hypothetical protein
MDNAAVAPPRRRRWWLRGFIALVLVPALLAGLALAGLRYAAGELRNQLLTALGAYASVGSIDLDGAAVVIEDLRIRGPVGWPVKDALRARRITVKPDLRSLLSGEYRIAGIEVEQPYVSVWRTAKGRVRLLPSLLERRKSKNAAPVIVTLNRTILRQAAIDFVDASVASPAHRVRLQQMDIDVGKLVLPALDSKTDFKLTGVIRGPAQNGTASIEGWARFSDRDSAVTVNLDGVDLVALEPYLVKTAETGVERGTMDLTLRPQIENDHLHAPGTLTLTGLELKPGGPTFMGMPRKSVIAAFKNRNQRITVRFTLDGDVTSPNFSLNESLAGRASLALAKGLGVGLADVGTAGWETLKGVGHSFTGLFRKDKKPDAEAPPPEEPAAR